MKPRSKKILKTVAYVIGILLAIMLECYVALLTGRWTIIDLGGMLAEPGQMQPVLRPDYLDTSGGKATPSYPVRVWKHETAYTVEIPIAYVPAHYSLILHNAGYCNHQRKTLHKPYFRRSLDEIMSNPEEKFNTRLSNKEYRSLCHIHKSRGGLRYPITDTVQHNRVNLIFEQRAGKIICDSAEDMGQPHLYNLDVTVLPSRRTWYNRCLQPISWVAEVIDIPLSLIATPIGWLVDAIYEPLNN